MLETSFGRSFLAINKVNCGARSLKIWTASALVNLYDAAYDPGTYATTVP